MLAPTPCVCIAVTSTCNSRFSFFQLHECLAQVVTENLHIKRWLFKMDNEFGGRGTGTELSFILRIILGLNLVSFWSNTGPIRRCPYWTSCVNYSSELSKLFSTTKVSLVFYYFLTIFKAHFHPKKISTDRKFSENIIVKIHFCLWRYVLSSKISPTRTDLTS
jgi:hypothetical protein